MHKNPILYRKISKRSLRKGTSVIGIYGMCRYVGVTHLTLLLAFYLSDVCGYKVVVIEASGKDDAERCIELCKRNEGIFYLFNFTSALDFQVVVKNMKRKKCLRVPYEPRIVLYNKTAVMEELFFQILQDFL